MKKYLIFAFSLFLTVSNLTFSQENYSLAGISLAFSDGAWGIGGEFIRQNNGSRLGAAISYGSSGVEFIWGETQRTFGLAALAGFNFGDIFFDLGLGFGFGRIVANEEAHWGGGTGLFFRPNFRTGDTVANTFSFTLVPAVSTEFNVGGVILKPSLAFPLTWLRAEASTGANREISSEISWLMTGTALFDLINSTNVREFSIRISPGVAVVFDKFYLSLGLSIPIRINSELEMVFADSSRATETSNPSGNVSFSIGGGIRF